MSLRQCVCIMRVNRLRMWPAKVDSAFYPPWDRKMSRLSAYGLSNNNKWQWWMCGLLAGSSRLAWSKGRKPPGLFELVSAFNRVKWVTKWRDDGTIKIKSYTGFRLPPKCMTLNDIWARFKVTDTLNAAKRRNTASNNSDAIYTVAGGIISIRSTCSCRIVRPIRQGNAAHQCSNCRGRLNPLSTLERPPPLEVAATPSSLAMNVLLLIITCLPSTTMHPVQCICILTAFGYK